MNKTAVAILFILFCAGCETSRAHEVRNKSLLENESYWGSFKGQVAVNCDFDACFPKKPDAMIGCDMRCLFTKDGYGLPEATVRAFEGKKPVARGERPHFIVAYGPPASGKSNILNVLEKSLRHEFGNMNETTIEVNVDDVFQGGEVGKLFKQYRELIMAHAHSPEEREIQTQRLYVYYRWVADQIADGILNQALAGKYNVLWETTGASNWPRREIARTNSYGYNSIVVYPLVETNALINRAQERAKQTGQEAAPAQQIRKIVDSAQNNLIDLLPANRLIVRDQCPTTERFSEESNPNICRARRVILIDNNSGIGSEEVIFDSKFPHQFCNAQAKLHLIDSLEKAIEVFENCPR